VLRVLLAIIAALFEVLRWLQTPTPTEPALKPVAPVDAYAAIANALGTAPVIGLSPGEGHGDQRGPEFLIALIRDPRITAGPLDVVMEGASGRYQAAMDRYVRGDAVADAELRRIWDDTTQQQIPGPVWEGQVPPVYRAIREVNATLPRDRQMRALLGDPPIEWEHVHTPVELRRWLEQRDSYPAAVILREVIGKGRKALVYFGGGHLQRRQQLTNYVMDDPIAQTVVSLVERAGTRTFIVLHGSERDSLAGWPVPSLALLRGTTLGAEPEPSMGADSPNGGQRVRIVNGTFVPIPRNEWKTMRRDEQADALVYLGPRSTRTEAPLPREMCRDAAYVRTRLQRMSIGDLPPSVPQRLMAMCGIE